MYQCVCVCESLSLKMNIFFLVDLTTNKMVTTTLFTLTYTQDIVGKSMLFIYCENASKFLFIHTIKTTMSHYILDTFRIYEVSSPKYWAYLFFARWYNDEIKWWKQTWLDFNNNHRSLNICSYTNVCLCFHICDDTFSAKNGEQRCTGNP